MYRQTPKAVIASQCRNTGVAIRSFSKKLCFQGFLDADSHTSDIGHWFGMTANRLCLHIEPSGKPEGSSYRATPHNPPSVSSGKLVP